MPADVLVVLLEGRRIGEIERRSGGLHLRYDDAHRSAPSATRLSVSMPGSRATHGDDRVSPWLWGLLPDNADVLERWGRDFGVSVASPFPLLGTQVGHDCAGAVQLCRPDALAELVERSGDVEWLTDDQVAGRIASLRVDATSWLGPGFTGQFSLGGAQAKTALHRSEGRWGVPHGSTPTTHILKPAMAGLESQDLNEHLCLTAARFVGLRAASTSILDLGRERAIAVERFDRVEIDGVLRRVHQEDLCQALSLHPTRKYQAEGGPSPGRIAELIRRVVPSPFTGTDLWRFVDALAFNWIIGGTDAHAKNYGFLLTGAQVRLAPLYDVASILPYDTSEGHRVRFAMKIGSDYRLPRTDRHSAWQKTAAELELRPDDVVERVAGLAGAVPAAFERAATDASIARLGSDLPGRLVDLVGRRAATCLAALG
ncbi:MAG: type II toxin-antitoxin system HipA family toxin [Actinomycetota bacterium]|nr:type II toxin-antitoxin system HipA family toxin [Actinomycetota bacterium]